jgi:hypothetical protein
VRSQDDSLSRALDGICQQNRIILETGQRVSVQDDGAIWRIASQGLENQIHRALADPGARP